MAEAPARKKTEAMRSRVLYAATKLFLEKGYSATSLREIAAAADMNTGSLMHLFSSKEKLLSDLVLYVLEGQFQAAEQLVAGQTDDKLLIWAVETTLQLYIAESNEHIRELYMASYSLPSTSELIQRTISKKMMHHFADLHPNFEEKDFYEIEIATSGIIRGFMSVPCDIYFTMERKVNRFLEVAFLVYRAPDEKIADAIAFVKRFDFVSATKNAIESMTSQLENPGLGAETKGAAL